MVSVRDDCANRARRGAQERRFWTRRKEIRRSHIRGAGALHTTHTLPICKRGYHLDLHNRVHIYCAACA